MMVPPGAGARLRLGAVAWTALAWTALPVACATGRPGRSNERAPAEADALLQPTAAAARDGEIARLIRIDSPAPYARVSSPLWIAGQARGPWYFEASFPVTLIDANGRRLAQGIAQAQGEWMTEAFVPFGFELAFAPPQTATGTLIFTKDNPSGLPEHAREHRVPVRFRER